VLIAGFGSAFALAHSTSGRTVKDPPRVVTVIADAKVVGATAASVRLSTPADLEGLVVSGKISSLAPPAYTQHTTQTTTQTTAGPGTTYVPT
jgi:hypothetical protein